MTMSMSDPQASGTPLRPPLRILLWLVVYLLCALFAATAAPVADSSNPPGATDPMRTGNVATDLPTRPRLR